MPTQPQDPHDLRRFLEAQAVNYEKALAELRGGLKRSHWSWYVLPQVRGLGSSAMSVRYGISGLPEAEAYLEHPILGPRLLECVAAMNAHRGRNAEAILGTIDAKKFHSCLTLFAQVAGTGTAFQESLEKYFSGVQDAATMAILRRQPAQDKAC